MRMTFLAMLCATAGVATSVSSQTPPTQPSEPPKEKKICRTEASTGSLMTKRICHTKAEWAQIDATNQEQVRQLQQARQQTGT